MSCQETQDNLSAYLDGELPGEAARTTERHLEECAVCRDLLRQLRSVADVLHRLPPEHAPEGLSEEIQSRLERRMLLAASGEESDGAAHADRRLSRERPPAWPRVAAIAACLFLAAGIAWLLTMPGTLQREAATDIVSAPEGARPAPWGDLDGDRVAGIDYEKKPFGTGEAAEGDASGNGRTMQRRGGGERGGRAGESEVARKDAWQFGDSRAQQQVQRGDAADDLENQGAQRKAAESIHLGVLYSVADANERTLAVNASNGLILESGDSLAAAEAALGAILTKNGIQLSRADTTLVTLALADTAPAGGEKKAREVTKDHYAQTSGRNTVRFAGWLSPAKAASLSYDLAANPAFRVRNGSGVFVTTAKLQEKLQLATDLDADARSAAYANATDEFKEVKLRPVDGLLEGAAPEDAKAAELGKKLETVLADDASNNLVVEPVTPNVAEAEPTPGPSPEAPARPAPIQSREATGQPTEGQAAEAAPTEEAPEQKARPLKSYNETGVAGTNGADAPAEQEPTEDREKVADTGARRSETARRAPAEHAALHETTSKNEGKPAEAEQPAPKSVTGGGAAGGSTSGVVRETNDLDEAGQRVADVAETPRPAATQATPSKGKEAEGEETVDRMQQGKASLASPSARPGAAAGSGTEELHRRNTAAELRELGETQAAPADVPLPPAEQQSEQHGPAAAPTPDADGMALRFAAKAVGGEAGGEGRARQQDSHFFGWGGDTGDAMFVVLELTFVEDAPTAALAAERAAKAAAEATQELDAEGQTMLRIHPEPQPATQE